MSDTWGTTALSKRYMDMDYTPQFDGYSGVEIVVDKDTTYFAGDTTGRILTIQNPWGTQQQANDIIEKIRGFQYQPYTATGALVDPASELGDGISARAFYSGIFKFDRTYNSLMPSDVSAPQDEEVDHEYPFEPQSDRDITRRFTAVESELSIQSNQIAAKVSETGGNGASFGWTLTTDGFILRSQNKDVFKVDATGAYVDGVITATSGKIGGFNIGDRELWNNIDNFNNDGGLSSGVYLGLDGIRLGNTFSVDQSGNVKMGGTLTLGGTQITAANLAAGANSSLPGGYCYGGAGGGYTALGAFNNENTVTYMKAQYLTCTGSYIKVNNKNASWKSETFLKSAWWTGSSVATTQGTIYYLGSNT